VSSSPSVTTGKTVPKEWKETTLGDIASITRGASPRPIHEYLRDEGMPWIKIADATASHDRYIRSAKESIKLEGVPMSVCVYPGDLILSNSATPGIPKIVLIDACIHDGWLLFRDLKIDKMFLFYFLKYSLQRLIHSASGTVFKNLKTDIVKNIVIALPPSHVQEAISRVLCSLDDKIELLYAENKTLEAIAQAFFKRWFVEFNFPNDEGKPYRMSRGKMVDSELGKIPDGWKAGKIGDILELKYGEPLKMEHRSGKGFPVVGSSGVVGEHLEAIVKGPGIVVGRKGTMGSVIWIDTDFYPIDTTFYVVDKLQLGTLYYHLLLLKIQDFQSISSDSVVPGLNRNSAYSLPAAIPPIGVIRKFNSFSSSIYNKITQNTSQINKLSQLRDALLPRLVSGEVSIK